MIRFADKEPKQPVAKPPLARSTPLLIVGEGQRSLSIMKCSSMIDNLCCGGRETKTPATKPRRLSNGPSNTLSNAAEAKPAFDKRAYQRDLMRKRRAEAKLKAKA